MAEFGGIEAGGSQDFLSWVSGIERLESAELEQENARFRQMILKRELAGPGPEEKFEFEKGKAREQERFERAKFTLTTFQKLSENASPATKAVMAESFKTFWFSMSPEEQGAAKMIFDHSMMNPIEQKKAYWDETHKPPQVTADPSKDPNAYVMQLLNLDDYHQMRENYISGTPIRRRKLLGIADGIFGARNDNDEINILSREDMKLDVTAERFKTNPGAILANGGLVYGENREVMVGGVLSNVRSVHDAIKDKPMGIEINPTSGSIASLSKEQQDMQDFLAAWAGKDKLGKTQGSRVYIAAQKMLDSKASIDETLDFVKSVYPGWNFRIEGAGKATIRSMLPLIGDLFDAYAEGDKERIVAWPGVAMELKAKDGSKKAYYDARSGKVYGGSGKVISNDLNEIQIYFATKTIAEIDKEMAGK